ncbi:MAG: hypothetical protein BAJALOKI2v1_150059 [Promethearchaeota archaeon]|nr:MAG: hypothetical protein BAJALOKI2v1_150059 [Candidatus Lokiarchaeota archaeon]
MSMYRSYLLKKNFWTKKNSQERVFIKHDSEVGGIYAIIDENNRGVRILINGEEHFFNNFDKLDLFLNKIHQRKDNFMKILKRKNISSKLRKLDI